MGVQLPLSKPRFGPVMHDQAQLEALKQCWQRSRTFEAKARLGEVVGQPVRPKVFGMVGRPTMPGSQRPGVRRSRQAGLSRRLAGATLGNPGRRGECRATRMEVTS